MIPLDTTRTEFEKWAVSEGIAWLTANKQPVLHGREAYITEKAFRAGQESCRQQFAEELVRPLSVRLAHCPANVLRDVIAIVREMGGKHE